MLSDPSQSLVPVLAARARNPMLRRVYPKGLTGRSVRVGVLLSVLVPLNLMDLNYTLFAHKVGLLNEMNPIAEVFFKLNMVPSLVSYKLLMLLCGAFMLWRLRWSRWAGVAGWVLVAAYAALGVVWYLWSKDVSPIFDSQNSQAALALAQNSGG